MDGLGNTGQANRPLNFKTVSYGDDKGIQPHGQPPNATYQWRVLGMSTRPDAVAIVHVVPNQSELLVTKTTCHRCWEKPPRRNVEAQECHADTCASALPALNSLRCAPAETPTPRNESNLASCRLDHGKILFFYVGATTARNRTWGRERENS